MKYPSLTWFEFSGMELQNPRFMMVSAGRVLMLVENLYPQDPRVRNEALLLLSAGYQVSVICLRKRGQPAFEIIDGVRVYRLPRLELFKKTPSANSNAAGRLFLKLKALL